MFKFTDTHEWLAIEGDIATVGITSYAQKELGDIVYVELPPIGKTLTVNGEACVLESTKAATDIYAPISGVVIAINEKLLEQTSLVNTAPHAEGWLFKMKISNKNELDSLLSQDNYLAKVSPQKA